MCVCLLTNNNNITNCMLCMYVCVCVCFFPYFLTHQHSRSKSRTKSCEHQNHLRHVMHKYRQQTRYIDLVNILCVCVWMKMIMKRKDDDDKYLRVHGYHFGSFDAR